PGRTLSPRISTTLTTIVSSITMLSFFLRERTNIAECLHLFRKLRVLKREAISFDPAQSRHERSVSARSVIYTKHHMDCRLRWYHGQGVTGPPSNPPSTALYRSSRLRTGPNSRCRT